MAKFRWDQLISTGAQIATGMLQGHQAGLQQRRAAEDESIQQALRFAQIQSQEQDRQQQAKQQQAGIIAQLIPNLTGDSQQAALEQIMGAYAPSSSPSPYAQIFQSPLVQRRLQKAGIQAGAMPGVMGGQSSVGAAPPVAPGVVPAPPSAPSASPVAPAPMAGGMTPTTSVPRRAPASGLKVVGSGVREEYDPYLKQIAEMLDPSSKAYVRDAAVQQELRQRYSILTRGKRQGTPLQDVGLGADILAGIPIPEDPEILAENRAAARAEQVRLRDQQEKDRLFIASAGMDAWKAVQNDPQYAHLPPDKKKLYQLYALNAAKQQAAALIQQRQAAQAAEAQATVPQALAAPAPAPGGATEAVAGNQPYPEIYDVAPYQELQDTLAAQAAIPERVASATPAPAETAEPELPAVLTPEQQRAEEEANRKKRDADREAQQDEELFPLQKRKLAAEAKNAENEENLESLRLLLRNRDRNDRVKQQNLTNGFRMQELQLDRERQQVLRIGPKVPEVTKLKLQALNRDMSFLNRQAMAATADGDDDKATQLLDQASEKRRQYDEILGGLPVDADMKTAVENAVAKWEKKYGRKATKADINRISKVVRGG